MRAARSQWGPLICTLTIVVLNGCATVSERTPQMTAVDGTPSPVEPLHTHGTSTPALQTHELPPLHMAAKNGQRDVVARLLQQGAPVDDARLDGMTPLAFAVQAGHGDIVALLLEHGAKVNTQARIGGITLLHVGAYRGDRDIVALLLKYGGDKQARTNAGERPVDLALQQGHTALIPLLEP